LVQNREVVSRSPRVCQYWHHSEMDQRPLREELVGEEPIRSSFYRDELKTMCTVGWPMLVSFFCRFGMAAEDSAFVGHISSSSARMLSTGRSVLDSGLFSHASMILTGYAFMLGSGSSATVGYEPMQYLAAAGLSDMLTNIFIIPPLAFNQSLNALVSQAMGSGNKKMAGTWLQLSVITLTISYIPMLVCFFFASPVLRALGFDEVLCDLAGSYTKFNAFWPIPNGLYQCMRFYFQAQGVTKPAMYNNMFFLGFNAFLNWIFVFGGPFKAWFGWHGFGFVGAAISLSCSRSLQPVFYWLYMFHWKQAHLETWPSLSERTFMKREHVKSFFAMSIPQIGTLIFQAVVGQATTLFISKLGETAISASAAAGAATLVFGGLSPTLTAVGGMRVGFYLGKGEPLRANRVALMALGLGGGLTGFFALLVLPLARPVISIVTSDPEVQEPAVMILPAVMLNLVASIVVSIGTSGILTSQGRTKTVTFLSMGFELPFSLGSTYLLVFVFNQSLLVVYWAQALVSWIEAVVVLAIIQRSDWAQFALDAKRRQGTPEDEEQSERSGEQDLTASIASGISLPEQSRDKADAPGLGDAEQGA